MDNRKILAMACATGLLILAAAFVSCRSGNRSVTNRGPDGSSSLDPLTERYGTSADFSEEPPEIRIDYPDTFHGEADLTGEWEDRYDVTSRLTFREDGTFLRNGAAMGTWEACDGYVLIHDPWDHVSCYRFVADETGALRYLQTDHDALVETFRRAEGLPADELLSASGEPVDEETLRFTMDTILQILKKSTWRSEVDTIRSVAVEGNTFRIVSNSGAESVWPWRITTADMDETGYFADILVNDVPCRITVAGKGQYGSEGYHVTIQDGDAVLLAMESYRQVELEQP